MLPTDDLFFAGPAAGAGKTNQREHSFPGGNGRYRQRNAARSAPQNPPVTEDSIRTKLDNIIRNSTTNKFLQDAVVSLRNGRYVVPRRVPR